MGGKIITIDWDEISALPSDEYHIKLLNKQQAAVLQALCEYQHWETRWDNLELSQDELDKFMGDIEFRLMGDETGGFMTVEELIEGICGGLVCAAPKIGAMLATGVTNGFAIDEDGNVTTGTDSAGGGVELPEDNPATSIDETEASRYGGDVEISEKLETFIAQIDTLYGTVNGTPVTSATDTKNMIGLFYPVDEVALSDAIDAYYSWRATNGRILWSADAATAQYLYCNGFTKNAIARYFYTLGFTTQKYQIIVNMIFSLDNEFFNHYYQIGVTKPSNAYLNAACVPMPYQEYSGLLYGVSRSLLPSPAKGGHRIVIEVSGYYTDADGDLQDAFWYRTAAGVLTRSSYTFVHGSGANNTPSDVQVAYSSSHVYQYTIDLETGNNVWSVQFNRNANMNVASTSPTGGFTIKITDLGLAVSQ